MRKFRRWRTAFRPCEFPRTRSHGPTSYPVACSPQALAATTVLSLAQSCLGLTFNPAAGEVIFDRPLLPDFVDDITLRQIRVPGGQLDIPLARARKEGAVHVMDRTGSVRAVTRS